MKKILVVLCIFILIITLYDKKKAHIPKESIRFRILANSNSVKDQKIKEEVRDKLQEQMYFILKNSNGIKDSRKLINENLKYFDSIVKNEMKDVNYSYTIDYGMHYFPEKTYKGIKYESGQYESLLVTLGEGKGDNWWCVLFPPLCVLEAEETSKPTEYKSLIKEIIEKIRIN